MDLLLRDLELVLTMDDAWAAGPLGPVPNGAVALRDGKVAWVGPSADAPGAADVRSFPGCIALPGFVDAHTHAVWAGSRADEWEARQRGVDYRDALAEGGGIHRTVSAVRATPLPELTALASGRLAHLASLGTTTVEVKSGYGLDVGAEVAMLTAARDAGRQAGIRVLTTFLGAHVVPRSHLGHRDAYVAEVIEQQLPAVADLADFVDVFVDDGAFTLDEGQAILEAARSLGLGLKIHAEQLTFTGAAAMAARLGAVSADHLECIDAEGIAAMADHETTAVLLPGAMLSLSLPPPPVSALRDAGVRLCVATDLNPGSSAFHDLLSCAQLACLTMGLTVDEALLGITSHAGHALGRPDLGRLYRDGPGDVVVLRPAAGEPATPASLLQQVGGSVRTLVVSGGRPRESRT